MANEFENLDPSVAAILQSLLGMVAGANGPLAVVEEPESQGSGGLISPLGSLKSADKTIRDWIVNKLFPQISIERKSTPGLLSGGSPIKFSWEKEQNVSAPPSLPRSGYDIPEMIRQRLTEVTAAPSAPAQRATPAIPKPGEQIGTPQYTADGTVSHKGLISEWPVKKLEDIIPSPAGTEALVTPSTAATIPDFTKLIQPGKPKIDYEKELMDIFDKAVPKWEDLPKARSIEPKTPIDALTRFVRDVGLGFLGKDIFALKEGEIAKEEGKAVQERNYVIQRSSQLANFKLSALSKKMEQEEADRTSAAQWLEYLGNANKEYRKSPSYQAAVAALKNIPVEMAAPLLQSMVNPETGLLEGMYKSPIEELEEQQKAMFKINKQNLIAAGITEGRAAYIAAGGSKEMIDFYAQQYQNAIETKNEKKAQEIEATIKRYQSFAQRDVAQEKALDLIRKDPKLTSFDKIFSNRETAQYYKDSTYAQAMFGEKAKTPPHVAGKEVKVDEKIKEEAKAALGNPVAEKAFSDKYKHTAIGVLFKDEATTMNLPEPYATGAKLAPPNTAKDGDKLKMWIDMSPEVQRSIKTIIVNKYKPVFDIVNQKLIEAKKPLLSDAELYRIATAANSGNNDLVWQTIAEILTERKVPLSK